MTMAHGSEARVPFLYNEFTKLVMSVDPTQKMVDPEAVKNNRRGREKTLLRELFEEPNAMGGAHSRTGYVARQGHAVRGRGRRLCD